MEPVELYRILRTSLRYTLASGEATKLAIDDTEIEEAEQTLEKLFADVSINIPPVPTHRDLIIALITTAISVCNIAIRHEDMTDQLSTLVQELDNLSVQAWKLFFNADPDHANMPD